MASETKEELKARFKAGSVPSESDYAALIDTIAGTGTGTLILSADIKLRNTVLSRGYLTGSLYTFTNPYTYTKVSELLDAYSYLNNVDVSGINSVIVINESWDSGFSGDEDGSSWSTDQTTLYFREYTGSYVDPSYGNIKNYGSWANHQTSYTAGTYGTSYIHTSEGGHWNLYNGGIEYPMYILTDHSTVLPNVEEYFDKYGNSDKDKVRTTYENKVIDAIQRGRSCMFVKRVYRDETGKFNNESWVPVNRGTTVTVYELGQMAQDFAANQS